MFSTYRHLAAISAALVGNPKDSAIFRGLTAVLMLALAATQMTAAQANSPILVDGAGRAIGYVLDTVYCDANAPYPGVKIEPAVMSKTGYLACVSAQGRIDQKISPPYSYSADGSGWPMQGGFLFLAPDCSGGGYIVGDNASGAAIVVASAFGLIMTLEGSTSSLSMPASSLESDGCYNIPPTAFENFLWPTTPAFRADAAVIGFSTVPYSAPLSIKFLPDSALDDVIFFDGNEPGY